MTDILVIPDPHAKPGVSNRRFLWLSQYIYDTKPDIVVEMGDLFDMESLCSYDKGKKSFEGRRYKADLAAGHDALEKIDHFSKKHKKKRPKRKKLIGNHEERIMRAVESQPEFDGIIGIRDLGVEDLGWEVVPYDGSTPGVDIIQGIAFAHFFVSGVMGRPISGEHPAYSMLTKKHVSCVGAHSHIRDHCERNSADGRRIQAVVAGCFMDPTQREGYAGCANDFWWRGVARLSNVSNGDFDLSWISMRRLQEAYEQPMKEAA